MELTTSRFYSKNSYNITKILKNIYSIHRKFNNAISLPGSLFYEDAVSRCCLTQLAVKTEQVMEVVCCYSVALDFAPLSSAP